MVIHYKYQANFLIVHEYIKELAVNLEKLTRQVNQIQIFFFQKKNQSKQNQYWFTLLHIKWGGGSITQILIYFNIPLYKSSGSCSFGKCNTYTEWNSPKTIQLFLETKQIYTRKWCNANSTSTDNKKTLGQGLDRL